MKIWVTGALGMLGTALCKHLTETKVSFVGTGKEVDITSRLIVDQFLQKHKEITHIINCAAYTEVDRAEQEKEKAYAINVIGPENLGLSAKKYALRLIHISTDYIFDGKAEVPYLETSKGNPLGVYGATKFAGEQRVQRAYPDVCMIRTSWLFGFNGRNFVSTMLQLMENRNVLRVVTDQIGRPTFCDDLVFAMMALLNEPGIFHFANEGVTSWYDFAMFIAEEAKKQGYPVKTHTIIPIATSEYETLAVRPLYSVLDTTKFKNTINYVPRNWQEAVSHYLEGLKDGSLYATKC